MLVYKAGYIYIYTQKWLSKAIHYGLHLTEILSILVNTEWTESN